MNEKEKREKNGGKTWLLENRGNEEGEGKKKKEGHFEGIIAGIRYCWIGMNRRGEEREESDNYVVRWENDMKLYFVYWKDWWWMTNHPFCVLSMRFRVKYRDIFMITGY